MDKKVHSNKFKGSLYLFGSAFIYGLYGIYSRFIGKSFGSFSQSWIRSFIVLGVILLLFLTKRFEWKKINRKDIKWFLIWVLPSSLQPVITYIAFNHLPIATTYFLIYATMILGGILSGKIFFSEKFDFPKVASLILVFIGLILIYGSDISLIANIYVFMALLFWVFGWLLEHTHQKSFRKLL